MGQGYRHRDLGGPSFTETESEYLCQQRLGRVATSSRGRQPHVVPVVYEFDGLYLYFGGRNLADSVKFKHIVKNPRVAFVVDDLAPTEPWNPRGIEIRGIAEVFREKGTPYIRITARSKRSWGLGRN